MKYAMVIPTRVNTDVTPKAIKTYAHLISFIGAAASARMTVFRGMELIHLVLRV